jgi:hypothetical protein
MEFTDGTYGIIDCKFQGKDNDKSEFYAPQLEAYAFALENPASGNPMKISVMGLLVWSPKKPVGNPDSGFNLELNSSWFPIKRDPDALQSRLGEFISMGQPRLKIVPVRLVNLSQIVVKFLVRSNYSSSSLSEFLRFSSAIASFACEA